MPSIHCEAILLRSVDFGESDRIVHLLTSNGGRLTAIAKAARRSHRRFPGTLDVFNRLAIEGRSRPRAAMAFLAAAPPAAALRPARDLLRAHVDAVSRWSDADGGSADEARRDAVARAEEEWRSRVDALVAALRDASPEFAASLATIDTWLHPPGR